MAGLVAYGGLAASISAPAPAGGGGLSFAPVAGGGFGSGREGIPQGARDVAAAFADILGGKAAGIPVYVWILGAFLAGIALTRR